MTYKNLTQIQHMQASSTCSQGAILFIKMIDFTWTK
jgi:hypothetical protein